jgi:hypothetical protein
MDVYSFPQLLQEKTLQYLKTNNDCYLLAAIQLRNWSVTVQC